MKEIKLNHNKIARVSDSDFDDVSRYKWYAVELGRSWYARRGVGGHLEYLHVHIMNPPDGLMVDHIDGDGLNCTRRNMRCATRQQNAMNRKRYKNNTSGKKGVSWQEDNHKWRVYISVNGTSKNVGQFDNLDDATRAYDEAAKLIYGEFARTNEYETERPI